MVDSKIKFKDLSGWLKFGAATSIILGILYFFIILGFFISVIFFS